MSPASMHLLTAAAIGWTALPASPLHAQMLPPPPTRQPANLDEPFLALTPAHFQRKIIIRDDPLDTVARISTEGGYREGRGLLQIPTDDNFLRAFIDKKTGRTVIQLYQWVTYRGDKRYYRFVNFETPAGPEIKKVRALYRKTNSCSAYVGCSYTEDFAVEIPEALLRQLAAAYRPGPASAWRFKFGSKAGVETARAMSLAEIVALLATVDQYRSAHRSTRSPAPGGK